MAQQKLKQKPIGKKPIENKPLINPKYKNTFWTIVVLIVMTVFFIVNNTKSVPERGPYPPNYNSFIDSIPKYAIDPRVNFITSTEDSNKNK